VGQKQRRRNAFKRTNGLGFFAEYDQRASLSKLGDPLERLNACIDWETFREPLAVVYQVAEKAMPLVSIWRAFFAIIVAGFLDILR